MATIQDRHNPQQPVFPRSHVGFDSITSQIERKLLKRGFQFNVICVGEYPLRIELRTGIVGSNKHAGQTGLGKSTLINTIFASHLIDSKGRLTPDEPVRSTTEIQTVSHIIEENGVRLRLNIVDTPGYGDQVNNDRCWDPIVKYIKDQHSAYLRKELTAQRERYIQDTRIHCCLFFIQPSGHALKPIDIVVLKKLSDVVNVVPVIAKSDSLTLEERSAFKERIKEEFAFHNLKMYPYDNDEFDEEERALNTQIKVSTTFYQSCGTNTNFCRTSSHLPLWDPRSQLSLAESKSAVARTDGVSSTSRMRTTVNSFISETSSHELIFKT